MGQVGRKVIAVFVLTAYSLAFAPGTGAWVLCASAGQVAMESSLSSCCTAKHSAALEHSAHVGANGDAGCTDTPVVVPAHSGEGACPKLPPPQVMSTLPTPAQLPVNLVQPRSAQMSWTQSLALEDPCAIRTVVLLC